jgi:glutamine synthetase
LSLILETVPQPKGVFMKTAKDVLKSIKDNDVKYVDLRFTDPRGKWQHVTFDVSMVDEEIFAEGTMFDGSSIAGWKAINESDMCLMPDPVTATIDPFFAETTMVITCDVLEPTTGEPYNRDPRGIAKKAEAMVKSMGVGDTVFFGPEAEFFVFDDVRYQTTPYNTGFKLDSSELPINSDTEYEGGNLGHRIRTKAGYFPVPPQDSVQDMRSEMLGAMAKMGVKVEKHHHEVASAQHELGMKFDTMTLMADQMQIYKYCIHQVAHIYGKTATFMPKPVYGDNGSGMHCHQSIWKGGKPVFAGNKYADLSETCLSYIAGIIKHAKAINAFTNPSTNSYKRLVPGYEAPVLLAYSARNRSASCRIPYTANPKAKRVEVRFPDPMANPYLGFAAMLMAGLDGVKNKLDPGPAMDKDLYDLPKEELKSIPTVCGSLREALENLDKDRAFLKNGGVFDDDFIDSFIELKMTEVERFEMTPHPVEFDMYYSQWFWRRRAAAVTLRECERRSRRSAFCFAGEPGSRLHPEELGIARLDLFTLRLHLGGIGLEQLEIRQRDVLALLFHLRVERAVREDVDQHLLGFGAEEEALEQFCRVRIGRPLEDSAGNDDQWRSFGGVDHFHRLTLVLEQDQIVVVAVSHDGALAEQNLLRRIGSRLHLHDLLLRELFQIRPAEIACQHESRRHDGA